MVADTQMSTIAGPPAQEQRIVLADPIAFRYLQADSNVQIVESEAELIGYELHLVEQWACSRTHPTFLIVTFTGVPSHKVSVGVLNVPKDEESWSPRLKLYLKTLSGNYARRKQTDLGTIMVTNLNSFPSALTVIPIPESTSKDYRENFIVNENLKRLGCSGRSGLNLGSPSAATEAKFAQLYGTHERVAVADAVIELVKLCQIALVMFTKLDAEFNDGLLCDLTERAINDWWTEVGMDYFTIEPGDGVLGPSTVASIIGLFLGARNRLNAYGAPVAKDAFDIKAMKRGIGYFQKSQKIARTRKLDHSTLDRLHRVTSKAAHGEGWAVPRAVKSTVAELSGKGGEMVMGMVGARDRAGIAEIETADIQKFISSISGERCRWLWHGRPKKPQTNEVFVASVGEDDAGGTTTRYSWSGRRPDHLTEVGRPDMQVQTSNSYAHSNASRGSQSSLDTLEREQTSHKTVLKSVTDRMSDAKSGLDRFKDAVGISNRRNRPQKDMLEGSSREPLHVETASSPVRTDSYIAPEASIETVHESSGPSSRQRPKNPWAEECNTFDSTNGSNNEDALNTTKHEVSLQKLPTGLRSDDLPDSEKTDNIVATGISTGVSGGSSQAKHQRQTATKGPPKDDKLKPKIIRSTQSLDEAGKFGRVQKYSCPPRNASFSLAETAFQTCPLDGSEARQVDPVMGLLQEQHRSIARNQCDAKFKTLSKSWYGGFTNDVEYVEGLNIRARRDLAELQAVQEQKLEACNGLQVAITTILREERSALTDGFRDAETLGAKLDYEMGTLTSKVEDVEDGIADFERQVVGLEGRAQELKVANEDKSSWLQQAWPYR